MSETNEGGMPAVKESEEALLCCLMRYPQEFTGLLAAEGVDAACFYIHGRTHEQITAYIKDNPDLNEIETVHFWQFLEMNGTLGRLGGPSMIADITSRGPMENHWRKYAEQVKEMKARRMALAAGKRITEALDSSEAIVATREALDALVTAVGSKNKAKDAKSTGNEFITRWIHDYETGDIPGKSSGFQEIDAISGGMRAGEMWVIGGQSTRGKSVVMMQVASEFMRRGDKVAIYSLEMMAHEVTGRIVCVLGNIHYGAITQPRTANKNDRAGITRGVEEYKTTNVWIDDTGGQTLDWIEAESQRISDLNDGLDLIVIDYLQLVHTVFQKGVNREQEIAKISKGLKQLAKRIKCPVLTGTQLNEQGRARESKAIEQDADALLYIGEDGIKICKMRNGKRDAVIPLFLHGDQQKFLGYPPKP